MSEAASLLQMSGNMVERGLFHSLSQFTGAHCFVTAAAFGH
jgi:hypothetical protein